MRPLRMTANVLCHRWVRLSISFRACEVVLNLDTMQRCKHILQEKTIHQVPAGTSDAG
jgi:hypothetical protein